MLFGLFVVAAIAAIAVTADEYAGDATLARYVMAIADVATVLIAAVLAYVGSTVVEAIGRVRSSIIGAIFELEEDFQRSGSNGNGADAQTYEIPIER